MKWPWVSREQYDAKVAECAEWSRLAADFSNDRDALLEKYEALVQKALDRPLPAVLSTPSAILEQAPAREPSVVDAVIRIEAKGDQRLARYYRSRARTLREEHPHWNDQQVATELSRWETAEEMAPEFLIGDTTVTPTDTLPQVS